MPLGDYTTQLRAGRLLSRADSRAAVEAMIRPQKATAEDIAAFLTAAKESGETASMLMGGAEALRAAMIPFVPSMAAVALDCCGTGGDGSGSLNISTAVGFVVAACGVPVIKHGNRAVTSKSGSSDVLAALGISAPPEKALEETGLCFLLAPDYHPALKALAPIRAGLGFRTLFNMLGPLVNPGRPAYQLLGVGNRAWLPVMAEALAGLGIRRGWVVCGEGPMDELAIHGKTEVIAVEKGVQKALVVVPEDAGLQRFPQESLDGGHATENAARLEALLAGEKDGYREAVLLNAAAGLLITGKARDLRAGASMAAEAIDSGKALAILRRLQEMSV